MLSAYPIRWCLAALCLLVVGACEIKLAPDHDEQLVAGLNETNAQTLVLFSGLENGSPASAYSSFAGRYDEIIGAFDALRLRTAARDVPSLPQRIVDKLPTCRVAAECVNPTPTILETLLENLRTMKATHQRAGLQDSLVAAFKGNYEISIDQVLTVEQHFAR